MSESVRPLSLRGAILLADPSLHDPYFKRSVVLLTDHQREQGATGFVLNKPHGKRLGEILVGEEFAPLRQVPICIGGPVGREHLIFTAMTWQATTQRLTVQTHLSAEDAIQRQENGETIRVFLGYSGWGRGQLEQEIRENSWLARPASSLVLDAANDESLWRELFGALGPIFDLKARLPENPSQN